MAWISIVVPVEAPPPEGVPPGSSLGGAGTPGTPLGDTAGPGWGVAADTGMLSAGVEVGVALLAAAEENQQQSGDQPEGA